MSETEVLSSVTQHPQEDAEMNGITVVFVGHGSTKFGRLWAHLKAIRAFCATTTPYNGVKWLDWTWEYKITSEKRFWSARIRVCTGAKLPTNLDRSVITAPHGEKRVSRIWVSVKGVSCDGAYSFSTAHTPY